MDLRPQDEAAVRPYLREVKSVVDVGPGIRPQDIVSYETMLCIEPHGEYVTWLEEHGYNVVQGRAVDVLPLLFGGVDTVVALDVIEHMEREEGERFLRRAVNVAREQVVIFTPTGFVPQMPVDAWGMNGGAWQEHKSGWTPKDFRGWKVIECPQFHGAHDAFFAIHG